GSTLKIALWGSAVHQVGNDPIDCESRQEGVLVAVACTFVKSYLGRITLSSTNATKVYQNIDEPSVVDMRLRSSLFRPPRQITLPDKKNKAPTPVVDLDNRKTISQLISTKWDAYNQ
ncbi:hypothetical protein MKW94_023913, partial [Papaver nudicaule]|nr:hypothetical protein [Papaver nudicaule]